MTSPLEDPPQYDALGRMLQELPQLTTPLDVRARLQAALDEEAARPGHPSRTLPAPSIGRAARGWPLRWPVIAGALAAAAVLLFVWLGRDTGGGGGASPELAVLIQRGDEVHRAADVAAIGDRLQARLRVPGAAELRVYRGDHSLVARCPGSAGCAERDDRGSRALSVEMSLGELGRYRVVGLIGASIPAPTGAFDDDLRVARAGGARVVTSATIDVH
jgi:hypothetical protein